MPFADSKSGWAIMKTLSAECVRVLDAGEQQPSWHTLTDGGKIVLTEVEVGR